MTLKSLDKGIISLLVKRPRECFIEEDFVATHGEQLVQQLAVVLA